MNRSFNQAHHRSTNVSVNGGSAVFALQTAICYSLVSSLGDQSEHRFINNLSIRGGEYKKKNINVNIMSSASYLGKLPQVLRNISAPLDRPFKCINSTIMCE